jgi:aspartate racemase
MKTLGIIGGMGPLATHDFYRKVIEATPAADDPQHIPVVMVADTQIPLRIPAWEGRGPSPLPALIVAAQRCVAAGAQVLAMPCNTAHFWFAEMAAAVPGATFLHIADETLRRVPTPSQGALRLGLTGTHVTLAMGLYQDAAVRLGLRIEWVLPDAPTQTAITQAIADVKGGRIAAGADAFKLALTSMQAAGAQAVVLACTELPVLLPALQSDLQLIDATQCLANACVAACLQLIHPGSGS